MTTFLPNNQTLANMPPKSKRKHVSNSRYELHCQIAQSLSRSAKIACNNLQEAGQAYAAELKFYTTHALPLRNRRILRLAQISPTAARSPARRSGDGRETYRKPSGGILASYPRNIPAMAGQWQSQCRRMAGKMNLQDNLTCSRLDAPCPRRKLARRLASNLNHDIQKL